MSMNHKALAFTAVSAAFLAFASGASAQEKKTEMEKCYGVAKAGKNDCRGGGVASCAGTSKKDGDGFISVPKGLCERLTGGSTTDTRK